MIRAYRRVGIGDAPILAALLAHVPILIDAHLEQLRKARR